MRKLSPVAISVAMALGGMTAFAGVGASAASINRFATTTTSTQMTAAVPAAPTASPSSPTPVALKNTSTTDQRNAQTQSATATTHASGTPPANTTAATGTSTAGTATTNGATAAGSAFVSAAASAVPVALPGANTLTTINGQAVTPVVLNGVVGGMTTGGEFIAAAEGITPANSSNAELVAANTAALSGSVGTTTDIDTLRSSASLDKVIRTASAERRKIGRNGQLLQTIAPRTNADRSREMPDDGPSPALKGPLSR